MAHSINTITYIIRHNPNCPSPFEIRAPGSSVRIEMDRRDVVVYGETFEDAADKMMDAIQEYRCRRQQEFRGIIAGRELKQAAALVWA